MRCKIFNCDKVHRHQCCAMCQQRHQCENRCFNHPDRCGQLREETPREIAAAAGIRYISNIKADRILNSGRASGEYKPIGRFILKSGKKFIGIDNSKGDAWTEEFAAELECVQWLAGNLSREEYGL